DHGGYNPGGRLGKAYAWGFKGALSIPLVTSAGFNAPQVKTSEASLLMCFLRCTFFFACVSGLKNAGPDNSSPANAACLGAEMRGIDASICAGTSEILHDKELHLILIRQDK